MPYRDLREYLTELEKHGGIKRIAKEVDKDWEIAAVCRNIFTLIPEEERPALLFNNIKGAPGFTLVAGVLGASRRIYGLAMETEPDKIQDKWQKSIREPLEPRMVKSGPCKEVILKGDDVDILQFPWPLWNREHDAGYYITGGCVVTKDLRTGERNVGTYRQQIKGPRKTGMQIGIVHDGYRHILRNEEIGKATPIAICVGVDPVIALCSVTNLPAGADEYSVAGAIRGEPVELVKCETIDCEVPATAELVVEGEVRPNEREKEGPFGEFTGYMAPEGQHFVVDIKCISHRRNPILQAIISQMPPSESSTIRGAAHEQTLLCHLKDYLNLPVKDVHCLASGGADAYIVISVTNRSPKPGLAKQIMFAVWSHEPRQGKYVIVVDDDIDIRDSFMVNWALSFRVQPAQDVIIIPDVAAVANDPSTAPAEVPHHDVRRLTGSKMGIDALKKFEFPPIAMPPAADLDLVRTNWKEYGF